MRLFFKFAWIIEGIRNAINQRVGFYDAANFVKARFLLNARDLHVFGIEFPDADLNMWQQIFHLFFLREYSPPDYAIREGDIVIDIGANRGVFVALVAHMGARKVYAFEPDRDNFAYLSNLVEVNGFKQVRLFNRAVSDKNGTIKLYKASKNTRHTLVGVEAVTGNALERYEEVSSIRLDDILKDQQHVDLMKMDCEGAEFAIMLNASTESLRKIYRIVVEFHGKSGSPIVNRLINHLRANDFDVQVVENRFGAPIGMIFATLARTSRIQDIELRQAN